MFKKFAILFLFLLFFRGAVAMENQVSIIRKALLTAHLSHEKLVDRVEVKEINFAPSQKTGLHMHPCPVVGYIVKGIIFFQVEGEAPKKLKAGESFFEPANVKILSFDNASSSEPATFVAFYLLGKEDHELIRMLTE